MTLATPVIAGATADTKTSDSPRAERESRVSRESARADRVTCDTTDRMEKLFVFYKQRVGFNAAGEPVLRDVPAIITNVRGDGKVDLTLFEPGKVSHLEGVEHGDGPAQFVAAAF